MSLLEYGKQKVKKKVKRKVKKTLKQLIIKALPILIPLFIIIVILTTIQGFFANNIIEDSLTENQDGITATKENNEAYDYLKSITSKNQTNDNINYVYRYVIPDGNYNVIKQKVLQAYPQEKTGDVVWGKSNPNARDYFNKENYLMVEWKEVIAYVRYLESCYNSSLQNLMKNYNTKEYNFILPMYEQKLKPKTKEDEEKEEEKYNKSSTPDLNKIKQNLEAAAYELHPTFLYNNAKYSDSVDTHTINYTRNILGRVTEVSDSEDKDKFHNGQYIKIEDSIYKIKKNKDGDIDFIEVDASFVGDTPNARTYYDEGGSDGVLYNINSHIIVEYRKTEDDVNENKDKNINILVGAVNLVNRYVYTYGKQKITTYMLNGKLHNDNGPARITQVWENGNNLAIEKREYYKYGKKYGYEYINYKNPGLNYKKIEDSNIKEPAENKKSNKYVYTKEITEVPYLDKMESLEEIYSPFKTILKLKNNDEDLDFALSFINNLAFSYSTNDTDTGMDWTLNGKIEGGSFSGGGEKFSGSMADFIEKVAKGAMNGYREYKVLPSISIAQAILESGSGMSLLTKKANNLFGIKAFDDWKGSFVEMETTEYDAGGNASTVLARFRAYDTWDDSILDHSKLLATPYYKRVQESNDYQSAAYALSECGYATDPNYAAKLIMLIQQYGLYKYDD